MSALSLGTGSLAIGAGITFAGLVVATAAVIAPRPAPIILERRLPERANQATDEGVTHRVVLTAEKILDRRGRLAQYATTLELAGITMRPGRYAVLVAGAAAGLASLGTLFGGPLAGILGALVACLVAHAMRKLRTSRRQATFADQLDDSLQLLASSLRAGHSLLRALDAVSHEAEEPTAPEFARVINQTRLGRDLGDALDATATRMSSDDFLWVAQAIAIHRTVGGNLAEVLDTVGETIRERNQIRRQVKALSAEGKLSALVLMVLPFGVTGFLSLTNPSYLAKFTQSPIGYALLFVAVLLLIVGALWLRKVVSFKF